MIKIICVGKVKEKFYNDAINEYKKRIGKYTKIEIIELKDEAYDKDKTIKKESDEILRVINNNDYNIGLDISGNMLDSVSFANKIDNIFQINSNITFIIGGSYGFNDEVRSHCSYLLSFSKMTFPHQLFRVILLEQIYRSFRILNNEKYHK